jgi:hypothetical protein
VRRLEVSEITDYIKKAAGAFLKYSKQPPDQFLWQCKILEQFGLNIAQINFNLAQHPILGLDWSNSRLFEAGKYNAQTFMSRVVAILNAPDEVDEKFLLVCSQLQWAMCTFFELVRFDENYQLVWAALAAGVRPNWALAGVSLIDQAGKYNAVRNKELLQNAYQAMSSLYPSLPSQRLSQENEGLDVSIHSECRDNTQQVLDQTGSVDEAKDLGGASNEEYNTARHRMLALCTTAISACGARL